MKIPSECQVFERRVKVTTGDAARFAAVLAGWPSLCRYFQEGPSEDDLMRLAVLELLGRRRESIVSRLLSRLGQVRRKNLESRIRAAVQLRAPVPYRERPINKPVRRSAGAEEYKVCI